MSAIDSQHRPQDSLTCITEPGAHRQVTAIASHVRIVAAVLAVFAVVATPREAWWAFALYALIVLAVTRYMQVPIAALLKRMRWELPFVVVALLVPFIAQGERVEIFWFSVSLPGLWAAWNLLAKATLGVAIASLLSLSNTSAELVTGLGHLRLPGLMVQITAFMVRYLDVVTGELHRMRTAQQARGFQARRPHAWPILARGLGTLFIRSFERGERVHTAMLSRGYDGTSNSWQQHHSTQSGWVQGLVVPGLMWLIAVAALITVAVVA